MSKRKGSFSLDEQIDDNNLSNHQEITLKTENEQEQDYISFLKNAPEFVFPEDAPQFFNDILVHFDNKYMTDELGLEIFQTLRNMIRNPDFFAEFIRENILLQLPFDTTNPKYIDQILNVIYDVIQIDTTGINFPLGDKKYFAKTVKREPLKSLSLIRMFAEKCFNFKYEGEICPWALIDILYYEIETFIDENNIEIFKKYSSILLYILHEYPLYRDCRLESYWNLFIGCLSNNTNSSIIQIIYNVLCFLFDYFNSNLQEKNDDNKKRRGNKSSKYVAVIQDSESRNKNSKTKYLPDLPMNHILKHIRINSTTRGAVFKLLICFAKVDPSFLNNAKLIQYLLHYSTKSLNASLILMTIAENESIAKMIIDNGDNWLNKGLPQAVDTLRLFTVVFQFKHLRRSLVSNDKFVPFLNFVIEELKSAGTVSVIGLIISKSEISEEIMMKMRDEQFINSFLDVASQYDVETKVSFNNALGFIYTATKFGIYSDFLPYIQWISKLKDEKELKETVSLVVSELARNESCAKKMVSLRLNNYYERQLNDPSSSDTVKSNANKFLKRIQKFQKKE